MTAYVGSSKKLNDLKDITRPRAIQPEPLRKDHQIAQRAQRGGAWTHLGFIYRRTREPFRVYFKPRKVLVSLPGKGNSNSHGARPVHPIISMMKWIRICRLSIKKSLFISNPTPGLRTDGERRGVPGVPVGRRGARAVQLFVYPRVIDTRVINRPRRVRLRGGCPHAVGSRAV